MKDSFWEFFPESETWIEKKKFPGQIDDRVSLNYSFSLNNKLFIGNCYQSFALWEYSIDDDTWIRKTDMPDVDGLIYYTSCNYTFISENKGYVGIVKSFPEKNALWEYNPESDKWIKKSGLSEDSYRGITAFVINGEAFAGLGNRTYSDFPSKSIWKYYNSDWIKYQDCPMGLAISTSFVIQNKGYVLSYETNDYYTRHTLWEFDPSKN